jgi:hypothetical protein
MTPGFRRFVTTCLSVLASLWLIGLGSSAADQQPYYPRAGGWAHKMPSELGMDAGKLAAAIEFAKAHETYIVGEFGDTLRPDPSPA